MDIDSLFSLNDKTAVIIGGTGELCGAIAEGFAMAGAKVILVGRNESKAKDKLETLLQYGDDHGFKSCDVTSRQSIEDLHKAITDDGQSVDILVNGAGINSATPFLEITDEEFETILNINTQAVFRACQIFGKTMIEQNEGGSIINIGSMSGLTPLSRVFTYSMTKASIHNLSKNLAREWATQGVRVNTLVPGFFPAEQNKKVLTEDRIAQIMNHTPMKRFGEADELIGSALLLASDAGRFMTGSEIVVDGGYHAMTI